MTPRPGIAKLYVLMALVLLASIIICTTRWLHAVIPLNLFFVVIHLRQPRRCNFNAKPHQCVVAHWYYILFHCT